MGSEPTLRIWIGPSLENGRRCWAYGGLAKHPQAGACLADLGSVPAV